MATQAKERPILFSGEMVRAILDGRKTVTRRVIKPNRRWADEIHMGEGRDGNWIVYNGQDDSIIGPDNCEYPVPCPYGIPGDRLWVRETFAIESNYQIEFDDYDPPFKDGRPINWDGLTNWEQCHYRATDPVPELCYSDEDLGPPCKWKPSIHMPRWASRITLEVVSIRVERLQDISDKDAIAEGIQKADFGFVDCTEKGNRVFSAKLGFEKLWNSINGPGSWDSNPWVWRVEFKRVK